MNPKMLFCGYQLVSVKSVRLVRGAVICMLGHKQSELGTGRQQLLRYLVSLAIGVTYDCQFLQLECALFCCSSFFSFVHILLSNILSVLYCTWTIYVNITILWKYSGNGHTCASSQYQAVSLLPCGLGTRLINSVTEQNSPAMMSVHRSAHLKIMLTYSLTW